ncbi:MAG: CvpA family protein [Acidobacteriaceae bacterium]|jgi:membrane protein required for colicin V production
MNLADLNWFDWVLIAILIVSMVRAYVTGLVRAIAGLFGFVAGFEVASWGYADLGDRIRDQAWITSEYMARTVAFLVIIVVVVAVFELAGRVLQKKLRTIGLGTFDRILGAAFGFARACLIGIALLMAATIFTPQPDVVSKSVLRPYLFTVVHDVSFLIPDFLQQRIL